MDGRGQIRAQLLGSGPDNFNLAAVRSRAEEIRKSLDDVITTLATRAHVVQWSHVLDKFSVINTQFGALLAALRPMLASYVVHVAGVDSPEALRDLPVLTASSAIPEMAAQAESILAQAVEAAAGAPPNDAAALEAVQAAVLRYNSLLDTISAGGGIGRPTSRPGQPRPGLDNDAANSSAPLGARQHEEVARASKAIAAALAASAAVRRPGLTASTAGLRRGGAEAEAQRREAVLARVLMVGGAGAAQRR